MTRTSTAFHDAKKKRRRSGAEHETKLYCCVFALGGIVVLSPLRPLVEYIARDAPPFWEAVAYI